MSRLIISVSLVVIGCIAERNFTVLLTAPLPMATSGQCLQSAGLAAQPAHRPSDVYFNQDPATGDSVTGVSFGPVLAPGFNVSQMRHDGDSATLAVLMILDFGGFRAPNKARYDSAGAVVRLVADSIHARCFSTVPREMLPYTVRRDVMRPNSIKPDRVKRR
jgi:hypothetical protein